MNQPGLLTLVMMPSTSSSSASRDRRRLASLRRPESAARRTCAARNYARCEITVHSSCGASFGYQFVGKLVRLFFAARLLLLGIWAHQCGVWLCFAWLVSHCR